MSPCERTNDPLHHGIFNIQRNNQNLHILLRTCQHNRRTFTVTNNSQKILKNHQKLNKK